MGTQDSIQIRKSRTFCRNSPQSRSIQICKFTCYVCADDRSKSSHNKESGSRNSWAPLCTGECQPLKIRIGSSRTPGFSNSCFATIGPSFVQAEPELHAVLGRFLWSERVRFYPLHVTLLLDATAHHSAEHSRSLASMTSTFLYVCVFTSLFVDSFIHSCRGREREREHTHPCFAQKLSECYVCQP